MGIKIIQSKDSKIGNALLKDVADGLSQGIILRVNSIFYKVKLLNCNGNDSIQYYQFVDSGWRAVSNLSLCKLIAASDNYDYEEKVIEWWENIQFKILCEVTDLKSGKSYAMITHKEDDCFIDENGKSYTNAVPVKLTDIEDCLIK